MQNAGGVMPGKKTILVLILFAGAAALYFWTDEEKPKPQVAASLDAPAEPPIRYPIDEASLADEPDAAVAKPLPSLDESDSLMQDILAQLFGGKPEKLFNFHNIIRRAVATLDNLPRENLPMQLMPVKPVTGSVITAGQGSSLTLAAANGARYNAYVRLAEAVPTGALVAAYMQVYPLLQQDYEQLGYPGKYFNDRVVQVIDHLLNTPEVQAPVTLIQPKVLYEFADPKLEELSAGQKILVRIGHDNAVKVKAKLREIRSALVPKG
jgi:hypothetical protein